MRLGTRPEIQVRFIGSTASFSLSWGTICQSWKEVNSKFDQANQIGEDSAPKPNELPAVVVIRFSRLISIEFEQRGKKGGGVVVITDVNSFDEMANRSQNAPVVIFKHSTTCPISAAAYREMSGFDGEVALVEVQRDRELCKEIEQRTGVEHESPQVLVLRNGKVVWNASHWKVKADAVNEAVKSNEDGNRLRQ